MATRLSGGGDRRHVLQRRSNLYYEDVGEDYDLSEAHRYARAAKTASFNAKSRWWRLIFLLCSYDASLYSLPCHSRLKQRLAAQKIAIEVEGCRSTIMDERENLARQREALKKHRRTIEERLRSYYERLAQITSTDEKQSQQQLQGPLQFHGYGGITASPEVAEYREVLIQRIRERIKTTMELLTSLMSLEFANEESSIWNMMEADWSVVWFFQEKSHISWSLKEAIRKRIDDDEMSGEIGAKINLLGKKDVSLEILRERFLIPSPSAPQVDPPSQTSAPI